MNMFTFKWFTKQPLLYMSIEMLLESVFSLKWTHAFSVWELFVVYANKTDRVHEYHWKWILDNLDIIILNREEGPAFVLSLLNILGVIKRCLEKPRFFPVVIVTSFTQLPLFPEGSFELLGLTTFESVELQLLLMRDSIPSTLLSLAESGKVADKLGMNFEGSFLIKLI